MVTPIVNSIEISRRPEDVFAYVTETHASSQLARERCERGGGKLPTPTEFHRTGPYCVT